VSSPFVGTPPPAQKKTLADRTNLQAKIKGFLAKQLPKLAPGPHVKCPAFGSDQDEQDVADDILNAAKIDTKDSEELGELGAIFYLQNLLSSMKIEYDDTCLHMFSGANTFNIVYIHPDINNPTTILVIEAKGGNSGLGDRLDPTTLATVTQGTPEYLNAEAEVMKASNDPTKRAVGKAILKLMKTNQVAYFGVKTKYDKNKGIVYEPVPIFYVQ
jgi:hypothetical protein